MKVLVTGAGGFIGSHLCEKLVRDGFEVRAFLRYNSRNFNGWLEESPLKDQIETFAGDIRDYDSIKAAVEGVDMVFHLAALVGIPYSYVSPLAYVKTNVEGTYNVLEAALKSGVSRVIHTSTSEVYGTAQFTPITEDHPINPQSPYAATKAAADYLALSYYRSFDLPVTVVRPFNTYGPRQSARAVIPTIIAQILAGNKLIRLGNLDVTRDFTFVEDTAAAFISISRNEQLTGRVTNAGMNKEISIRELAELIARIMKTDIQIVTDQQRIRPGKSEVERLVCDNTRILENTDWKPQFSLERGLEATVNWMREHLDIFKPEIYNI